MKYLVNTLDACTAGFAVVGITTSDISEWVGIASTIVSAICLIVVGVLRIISLIKDSLSDGKVSKEEYDAIKEELEQIKKDLNDGESE